MKKPSIVAAAILMGFLGISGAAAQGPGPQGAGADQAAKSSESSHSYNPIKWIKKDPDKAAEKPKKVKNKKPAEKSVTPDAPPSPKG